MSASNDSAFDFSSLADDEFSFIWRIENFAYCLQLHGVEEIISSPDLPTDYLKEICGAICLRIILTLKIDAPIQYRTNIRLSPSISILGHGDLENPTGNEKSSLNKIFWMELNEVPLSEILGTKRSVFLPLGTLILRVRILDSFGTFVLRILQPFLQTLVDVESRSFNWTIKEFSTLRPFEKRQYLLTFLHGHPSVKIRLSWNKGFRKTVSDDVKLEMEMTQDKQYSLMICKIFLLDSEGNIVKSETHQNILKPNSYPQIWSFPAFIPSKKLLMRNKELYLPNDVLTLRIECISSIGIVLNQFQKEDIAFISSQPKADMNSGQCITHAQRNERLSNNLSSNLYGLYGQQKFCDLTLHTEDKTFSVHKSVLCAMSTVFFAMIERDMVESKTGVVDIPDLEAETLQQMIQYMYTENVSDLEWNSASKLYYAADKYRLLPLKERCSKFLIEQLTAKNVCDVLILADRHRDNDLKLACQQFIAHSDQNILDSVEFQDFERNNLEVAVETWRAIHSKIF